MSECDKRWSRLIELDSVANDQIGDFLGACSADAIELIRRSLRTGGGRERDCSFRAVELLDPDQRQELLPELVALACEPSYVPTILRSRHLILEIPRGWLSQHIETVAEPLLSSSDEWIYRRLLELYAQIDQSVTLRLAKRAAAHPNSEIREAGAEFIANPAPRQ